MSRKKSPLRVVFLSLIIIGLIGLTYIYNTSSAFEKTAPTIEIEDKIYWNGKDSIQIKIDDNVKITNYKIFLLKDDGKKELVQGSSVDKNSEIVELNIPKNSIFNKNNQFKFLVEAEDSSGMGILSPNVASKSFDVIVDKKRPTVYVISRSYKVTKGGSALVIFKAEDENLKDVYIEGSPKNFIPQPFYKTGYYISLVAWPVTDDGFSAKIVAIDMAGNVVKKYINFFEKNKNYKESDIRVNDDFIEGKITQLIEETQIGELTANLEDRFKLINEVARKKNEDSIYKIASKIDRTKLVDNFKITPFYPLKNGAAVASFGDHRLFYYNGKLISESYHLGLDLASIKHADIVSTNSGVVTNSSFNGIYGNMIMIDHGLGLSTIYGHCSEVFVSDGESVAKNSIIGKTGVSGLALGDHLHFGIAVQGIEVRPEEWMDKSWIKTNIEDIIKSAKNLIDGK